MSGSRLSKRQAAARALMRLTAGFLGLLTLLLLPAGTVAYWEAWAYLAVLFVPMTLVLVFLLMNDPALLERRMRMKEKQAKQGLIIKLGTVCLILAFALPGFDRRFGWSRVPAAAVIAADILVLLGYGLFVLVLKKNSYASRVVEVERGQRIVTTGPYAIVRHPLYLAALAMFLCTPVALGSWWALIPTVPMAALFVFRIRNEEQVLARELEGYAQYMRITRYRLIPGVW